MSIFKKLRKKNNLVLDSNLLPQSYGVSSKFNLSEGLKTTFDFDYLIPIYWEEVNPGDIVNFKINSVCRLNPTVAPIMDNMRVKYFSFFVPNRIIWKHWTNFMGEKAFQEEHNDYVVPTLNIADAESGSIADYLGCPLNKNVSVSALPFRAYKKIWNDWFLAFEIQKEETEYTDDTDDLSHYSLLKKGKPLDYFTSCTPTPTLQEVKFGLGTEASVLTREGKATRIGVTAYNSNNIITSTLKTLNPDRRDEAFFSKDWSNDYAKDVDTNLYVDLSKATAISVQDLWRAEAVQRLLMKDVQGGLRYSELIHSHWGVTVPDYRLQRAEFLGSCVQSIDTIPVAQTSSTDSTTPQGTLVGVSSAGGSDFLTNSSFSEHGIFMVLACADADVSYQNGLPKKFSKSVREDYMFPELANIGDQAVLNKEIYCQGNSKDDEVFGYQERYREYRQGFSKITGKLRSGVQGSLDVWHLAQKFNSLPVLNADFIKSDTPISRVLAVQNEPAIIADFWFDISMIRKLPLRSNYNEGGRF